MTPGRSLHRRSVPMKRRSAGFTLLEILIVISLLGVVLTLIGGAIVGANRAVAKADRYSTRLDEVRASQMFLRRSISQALPLAAGSPDAQTPQIFLGSAQSMTFYAPLPSHMGGGLYQHQIAWHDRRMVLTLAQLDGQALHAFGDPQVLLHDVKALHLSYRGVTPTGQPSGWLEQWPWPARLPQAVRIDASLGGPVPWPLERINLKLDLSSQAGGQ